MLKQSQILDEKNKILRKVSEKVTFPIEEKHKVLIQDMLTYLRLSQDDDYAEEHDIRAGMGLAFPQLGILKRIFVISYKNDDGTFEEHVVINPEIVSNSEEQIYVEEGEGCLSVNRPVEGIVPRYARVTVEYDDENGNRTSIRVREEMSVAFQHEIDHLNGILFVDKIDNSNKDNLRAI